MSEPLSRRDFLKLSGGGAVAVTAGPLFKDFLPPVDSQSHVDFRKDRIITVNSEPFFPIGLFYLPGPESPTSWQKLRDGGFNTIAAWWVNDQSLAAAELFNIKTVAYTKYAFPGFEDRGYQLDEKLAQEIAGSPSLLAWYGIDEPWPNRNIPTGVFDQLSRTDPHHPIWTNYLDFPGGFTQKSSPFVDENGNLITFTEFQNKWNTKTHTRITGFDLGWTKYVSDDTLNGALIREYYRNLAAKKLGAETQALWVILSAHSELERTYRSFWFQTIEAIANGATGVFFWDWPYGCTPEGCPTYPGKGFGYQKHWESLNQLGIALKQLTPGLTGVEVSRGNANLVAFKQTVAKSGHRYVFVSSGISPSDEKQIVRISPTTLSASTGLALVEFAVFGENRIVTTDEKGELTDAFGPMDARVYVQMDKRLT